MPVDLGVFERQKTIVDQQQLQDAFELKKALAIQGAQQQALQQAALMKQLNAPEISAKDLIGFQIQQQNNQANQDIRRESLEIRQDEKRAKVQAAQEVKNRGKQDFEDGLANLAARYQKLKELGGITSVNDGALSNLGSSMSSSGVGQAIGGMFGTKEQSERNAIAGELPLLTQAIKSATGMSAQQMNSNVELQTFLKSLGDPKNDFEANVDILANLSKRFGTGEVAQSLGKGGATAPAGIPTINPEAARAELARRAAARKAQ